MLSLRGGSGLNALILVLLALDRATKAWAMRWLAARGPVRILPFFYLTYVENTGAAFGLGRGANGPLIALASLLIAGLVVWRRKLKASQWLPKLAVSLVLAGAVGNLYDRLAYGWVVDFFDFRVWPVFNVADSAITIGASLLAVSMWLEDRKGAA